MGPSAISLAGRVGLRPGFRAEIGRVTFEERRDVVFEEIDFAADIPLFARFQAANVWIAVKADVDAFEKFVGGIEGSGEDVLVVGGEAADEAVGGGVFGKRPGIGVGEIDSFRDVHLAAAVEGVFGAAGLREGGEAAFGEDEAFVDVVGLLAAGEAFDADAGGLEPFDGGGVGAFVGELVGDVDFVGGSGEGVQEFDFADGGAEFEVFGVRGRFEEGGFVGDGGFVPILVVSAFAAKGFEVPDVHGFAGEIRGGEGEEVVGPGDAEAVGGVGVENGEENGKK